MKTLFTALLLFIGWTSYSQCGQLIWADEFNGPSLDMSKWAHENGNGCPSLCGWGNGEMQTYTGDVENIRVENGLLVIEAVREDVDGSQFTSSKLRTLGLESWTYGRFEARMRLPLGNGLWPAFWMLSDNNNWPMTGEIDIMEYRGDKPLETHGTLHYGSAWPNNQWDGNTYTHSSSLADDFHVYAVEWEENEIRWYFDDVLFKQETRNPNSLNPLSTDDPWPWGSNFYMILNLAVGGAFTGNPSADQVQLTKPTFEIDYVRVYNGSPGELVAITGPSQVLTKETVSFSVPEVAGAIYSWSTGNATVISGSGTAQIQLSWNAAQTAQVSVMVSGGDCAGQTTEVTKEVIVAASNCNQVFNNFEDIELATLAYSTGTYTEVNNPSLNSVNSSASVLRYTRSAATQYDVLFMDNVPLMGGNYYENQDFTFEMDIYTTRPVGTPVELQIASMGSWQDAWPTGRHSIYSAITSTSGAWETLTFAFSAGADPNRAAFQDDVDRLILLFNPNTTTGDVYYIDNLRQAPLLTEACTVTSTNKKSVKNFAIYPVPAHNHLTIELADKNSTAEASLTDAKGLLISSFKFQDKKDLDISGYIPGVYFLKISGPYGSSVEKIVIR